MKIIFFGTPKEVLPVLKNLIKNFEVVVVVTTPDQKSGSKQLLTPTPVKQLAQKHKIHVLTPQQWSHEVFETLHNFKPDLFVVAAYGKIIPDSILKLPKLGAINIHPSLLPKYRGPTPIQTALLNGDKQSGITFIQMDKEMDHGSILHQILFTLETTDTFDWLMQSTFAQAGQILPSVIEAFVSGKLKPQPQDDSQASYTKMITKQDGYFELNNPPSPEQIDRMIRAFYPWPTAWTRIPKIIVRNHEKTISSNKLEGKIIKFLPKNKMQIEGKNPVDLKDFLNGYQSMRELMGKIKK